MEEVEGSIPSSSTHHPKSLAWGVSLSLQTLDSVDASPLS
jgi:hypothetical protein